MKLVATSDFQNPRPATIDHADREHDLFIHKGARFSIGEDAPFEKLAPEDKKLVALLNSAGRIVAEEDKDKVALIDKEVTAEKKKAAAAKPAEAKK